MDRRENDKLWHGVKVRRLSSGLAVIFIGVVGFAMHRDHSSVGPWDKPDGANTHPVAHSDGYAPLPNNILLARDGVATAPNGIKVRLVALNKDNSNDVDHWWDAAGAPYEGDAPWMPNGVSESPPTSDGRFRHLIFEVSSPAPQEADYVGLVPGAAQAGLTEQEKMFHGWDLQDEIRMARFPVTKTVGVYVDVKSADRYLFGLASGPWRTIDTKPNTLGAGPYLDKVMIKGPWGTATVTHAPGEHHGAGPFAESKNINALSISIQPSSEPPNEEYQLVAYDATGTPVPVGSHLNKASIWLPRLKSIVSFCIQSRPYTYLAFDGIHYDPEPSLWKDIVWGPNQPTKTVRVGDLTAELLAICRTRTKQDASIPSRLPDPLYTVNGERWKDHPQEFDVTGPFQYNASGPGVPVKYVPTKWVAFLKLHSSSSGDQRLQGRLTVYGATSDQPGVGLHREWNRVPDTGNLPELLQDLSGSPRMDLDLSPQAKYVQFELDIASGPWKTAASVVPNPAEIKSTGSETRLYSLDVGSKIGVSYPKPDKSWVHRQVGSLGSDPMQTRTFAVLKSGRRILLTPSAYNRISDQPGLEPVFEFDRDATTTEGDVIALQDVATFEVETRSIEKGFLAMKVPEQHS